MSFQSLMCRRFLNIDFEHIRLGNVADFIAYAYWCAEYFCHWGGAMYQRPAHVIQALCKLLLHSLDQA